MSKFENSTPIVMALSSLDPSGSSGIQADIETASSLGCHCTPIITALCARDTRELKEMVPTDTSLLIEQTRAILEDMPVKAIKLGFLASVENIEAVHTILQDYDDIPVILDPAFSVSNKPSSDATAVFRATESLLLPLASIVIPDLVEAYELAKQADSIDSCAHEIMESGCQHVLITGSKRNHQHIENSLYGQRGLIKQYRWQRLPLFSHGCGSTLAASIATYLAHGLRLSDAAEQGQHFTWQALASSRQLGMGKRIPNRLYWADKNGQKLASGS